MDNEFKLIDAADHDQLASFFSGADGRLQHLHVQLLARVECIERYLDKYSQQG